MNGRILAGGAMAALAIAGCGDGDGAKPTAKPTAASREQQAKAALAKLPAAKVVAQTVKLRGLRFTKGAPKVVTVTPAQTAEFTRRQGSEASASEVRAARLELSLLGLVPPGADLRKLGGEFTSSALVGFYDPKRPKVLSMVAGPQATDPVATQAVLAHELTHALQDQNFGLLRNKKDALARNDSDAVAADTALREGDGRLVEDLFKSKVLRARTKPREAGAALGQIPPAYLFNAVFPYTAGPKFVAALVKEGGGRFGLVDRAWRSKPPATTEQIIHPEKYLAGEAAKPVRLSPRPVLGKGFRRLGGSTFGELDVLTLFFGKGTAKGAALKAVQQVGEGWGGGRYELRVKGSEPVLVVGLTWDTKKDAGEFADAYGKFVRAQKGARARGGGLVQLGPRAFSALARRESDTTLAIASSARLARELAAKAQR